ncbi:MAG: aminotransferase class III-fold pyridoxal phosphate-dependent enzyme [Deltaproteobacteria bacterium]|nr:aminotransferase class III-fold pyridoxal phosphate-dependent enzyme [Deltaproteobacteria bacterium]
MSTPVNLTNYEAALRTYAEKDPDFIVMTAENRAALRSLPPMLGDRFIDVGICEQTMIGMAAGLALRGRKPIVHALAAFLTMRAYEFVRTDVGIPRLPVKLVGGVPGLLSDGNGPTHQAIEDLSIMGGIPGMKLFCPADDAELGAALPALMADPSPCYIRFTNAKAIVEHPLPGQPHLIETLADGGNGPLDVAILTHGLGVAQALLAHEILAEQGVRCRVLNVRMPKPLDKATALAAVRDARLTVIVEDHFRAGGLYSILSQILVEERLPARVVPIDLGESWFRAAMLADVQKRTGLDGPSIAARVLAELGPRGNTVAKNAADPVIAKSQALWARRETLIPAGTQTLAKGPGQNVDGVAPKYLARGKGARVWDVDGNEYLDMSMAIGPLSLGYGYPAVDDAIRAQLDDGITFSLMHPLEVEVAELMREVVPGCESVRYSKTGCDVTTAAVRLARAFTKRDRVVCCGYHGWHDWYIGVTDRNAGIPQVTQDLSCTFDYNNVQSVLDAIDDQTACVILEPMVVEHPKDNFLGELRRICDERGILLVFDEMWTGFRLALGGAQEKFGVRSDLACFSKAMANGMPISAITGRADVMKLLEKDIFFFTTFGGEALSLAAAKATIQELRANDVPAQLAARGARLREGYQAITKELGIDWTNIVGMDARTMLTFDGKAGNPLELKSFVQQELIRRGILWTGFHNMSYAHSEADVDYTLGAYREILPDLANHVTKKTVGSALRGKPVEPVFRRVTKFNMKPKEASK